MDHTLRWSSAASARRDVVAVASKVPRITLAFWIVKICATTLGETGGEALSMSLNLGYAVSTLIFLAFFVVTLAFQLRSRRYHPLVYWLVVVATTTVGTTTSDDIDRTLNLGYVWSSAILLALVIVVLIAWRLRTGSIVADRITTRTNEAFYWVTILMSNTLGTALSHDSAEFHIPELLRRTFHTLSGGLVWRSRRPARAVVAGALLLD